MKNFSLRIAMALALTGFIGWLDYATGDELDLFILYFGPIVWAAWRLGSRVGIFVAVEGTVLWYLANAYLGHAYANPLFGVWGGIVMLATFSAAALASSRIHTLLERERLLNHKLADALARVKKLSGRLPICLGCKSIRDQSGQWHEIQEYFTIQSEDDFIFSQTVCPHCRVMGSGSSSETGNKSGESVVAG